MLSDDPGQDHDSIYHIQELINKYLTEDLGYKGDKAAWIHWWLCCPVQIQTLLGSLVLLSCWFWLFDTVWFLWNISHQRGVRCCWITYCTESQQAVLQRTTIIKDAKTMYDFLLENISHLAAPSFNAHMKPIELNWCIFFISKPIVFQKPSK